MQVISGLVAVRPLPVDRGGLFSAKCFFKIEVPLHFFKSKNLVLSSITYIRFQGNVFGLYQLFDALWVSFVLW